MYAYQPVSIYSPQLFNEYISLHFIFWVCGRGESDTGITRKMSEKSFQTLYLNWDDYFIVCFVVRFCG